MFFRFRQLRRPELGNEILDRVTKDLADVALVESRSRMEGRQMIMVLAPLHLVNKEAKEATAKTDGAVKSMAPVKPAEAAKPAVTAPVAAAEIPATTTSTSD